ncbi:MAG TPA: GNAT family N-acetyltransferase [Gallionella sp.]|nr:GNAT family N-acetyltransferase [Gallionella sp.]
MQTIQLPDNMSIRPARDEDGGFIESLYRSSRDDLRLIQGEDDFIEELILMQHKAQTRGYGESYPNAFYFIIEKLGDKIGRIIVDFGHNEIRLVDVTFIREARGKGFGSGVIKALQYAAGQAKAPLTLTVHRHNPGAKRLYLSLGFRVEQSDPMVELMAWYPQ